MNALAPLCLNGSATIARIPVIREHLVEALAGAERDVMLDLSGVEQADVTLVQLVLGARIALMRESRTLGVAAWSNAACDAFVRAGVAPESLAFSSSTAG